MATKEKSFEDLVKEAPEAPAAQHVSLVGTLSKSHEPGKFVLSLQEGGAVTLDISDVKSHAVLGASVGQTIVRIEVEAERASKLDPQPSPWRSAGPQPSPWRSSDPNPSPWALPRSGITMPSLDTTLPGADTPHTSPEFDHPFTLPAFDLTFAFQDQIGTAAWVDAVQGGTGFADPIGPYTAAEGIPDPYGGYGQGQFGAYSPFALATPHQAPQAIVTAMQGLGNFGPQTVFWADHLNTGIADTFTLYPDRTVASSDVIHTDPRFDSGATNPGGPPHTLD